MLGIVESYQENYKEGQLAKRGRKPKARAALETNVNLIREVSAVVLIVLGLVMLLAMFNAGGRVGLGLKSFAFDNFGLIGAVLPVAMIIIGFLLLSPNYIAENKKQLIGGILGLIILTALLGPYGGNVGMGLNRLIQSGFGAVGTYIFLLALFILDLIIAFGISPRTVFERLNFFRSDRLPGNIRVIEPGNERVSVFTSVKRRIGWGRKPEPAREQMPLPVPGEGGIPYEPPPIDLLTKLESKPTSGNIAKNVEIIRKKLRDFGVEVAMGDVNVGPTVTQYQLKPSEGVKLNQITSRSEDLALALAAHPVRIEAPIPGKSAVGVEVPNKVTAKVSLRGILDSEKFKKRDSDLTMALGLDVAGIPITVDLAKLPHLLIAGATGSGKSVCINAIITTFIYQNSPDKLRFILVDPKRVEFTNYNGIPHLLSPVIVDVDKTVNVLKWTVAEMERRFRVFQELGVRDLASYNSTVKGGKTGGDGTTHQPMPNIIVIIDELSDLMAQSANEVEGAIVRLAQMARATGIHLIIATQRPSVNVITGLIKANIPARIAFAVASQVDSRTILDISGAEKLLGNGDMLYLSADTGKPKRVQGVLVSDKEIRDVTSFLKRHGHAVYDQSIMEFKPKGGAGGKGGEQEDVMYDEAKEVVVRAGKASASLLQRRLKVGYARAARLLDILEANGVVGPAEGAKPRDVYLDKLEVDMPQQSGQETSYNYQNPQPESSWPQSVPPPSAPPPKEPEPEPEPEPEDGEQENHPHVTEISGTKPEEKAESAEDSHAGESKEGEEVHNQPSEIKEETESHQQEENKPENFGRPKKEDKFETK